MACLCTLFWDYWKWLFLLHTRTEYNPCWKFQHFIFAMRIKKMQHFDMNVNSIWHKNDQFLSSGFLNTCLYQFSLNRMLIAQIYFSSFLNNAIPYARVSSDLLMGSDNIFRINCLNAYRKSLCSVAVAIFPQILT